MLPAVTHLVVCSSQQSHANERCYCAVPVLVLTPRSLALKTNYRLMALQGPEVMLEKLVQLYEYTSICYLRLCNQKYMFEG